MKKTLALAMILFFALCCAAHAERLAVAVPKANVRTGPDAKSPVLWQVEKYFPIEVIERAKGWVRFKDFEGDEAWVNESVLKAIDTVITKDSMVNVRSGPDKDAPVVFKTESGVPLKVLKREGEWINIEHGDGEKGWVHNSLVW
jgi:SH3-like domain-containing protein